MPPTSFPSSLSGLIPWPTAIAAEYVDRGSEATAAAALYAGVMLLMGLSFALGWRYLAQHPEMVAEQARVAFRAGTLRALLGGLVYLVAIAVAFLSPAVSFAIDALVALYFVASRSRAHKGMASIRLR